MTDVGFLLEVCAVHGRCYEVDHLRVHSQVVFLEGIETHGSVGPIQTELACGIHVKKR